VKSDGRGSGFMVPSGGGTDIFWGVSGGAGGDGAWPQLARLEQRAAQVLQEAEAVAGHGHAGAAGPDAPDYPAARARPRRHADGALRRFRSNEDLVAGVADRIWRELRDDVDPAAPWPAQLQVLLESLVDVLRAHPSASRLLGRVRHGPARPRAAARAGPVPSRPAA
jgi:hypothetical protein